MCFPFTQPLDGLCFRRFKIFFLNLRDNASESFQGVLQYGAGRTHIEPHETLAAGTEHLAVIQGESGPVDEQTVETLAVKTEPAAVEPHQERRLRSQRPDLRDVLAAEVLDELDVTLYIVEHLPSPFGSMTEGGDGRYMIEGG